MYDSRAVHVVEPTEKIIHYCLHVVFRDYGLQVHHGQQVSSLGFENVV